MKDNKAQSGPPAAVLDGDESRAPGGLLSAWRRPSKDTPAALKRPVKFFADWSAEATDLEEPEKPTK